MTYKDEIKAKDLNTALAEYFNLGEAQTHLIPLTDGRQHSVWRLQTSQGMYVVKQLKLSCFRTIANWQHFQACEEIAAHVARRSDFSIQAIHNHSRYLFQYHNQHYLVFPWIQGKQLDATTVTVTQLQIISHYLAELHSLDLQHPYFKFQQRNIPSYEDWEYLLIPLQQKNPNHARLITEHLRWFVSLANLAELAWQKMKGPLVLSHGDIWPANVIWTDKHKAILIDWEGVGFNHPAVELWALMTNWAGICQGVIDNTKLQLIYQYYAEKYRAHTIDKTVIYAGYESWLLWLRYNFERLLFCRDATDETRYLAEINHSIDTLKLISQNVDVFAALFDSNQELAPIDVDKQYNMQSRF